MKNLTSIDYLRALSMLYIVAYWHMDDYVAGSLGSSNAVLSQFTHVVLALFVFISGFLLGSKKTEAMSAAQFYKQRLLRIYPLYALAIGIFYLYGISDGWTSIKALLGVSMILQPAPLTLWFITMLVLFYLLTPLLLALVHNIWLYAAAVGGLMITAIAALLIFETVDPRVILYFPSFCLGLYCANHGMTNRLINLWTSSFALLAAIGLSFVTFPIETMNYLREMVLVGAAAYMIVNLCWHNENRFKPNSVIAFFSYSSFAMYLFHRPIYTSLTSVYFPESGVFQIVYLLTVGIFFVAIAAWSLQKLYDISYTSLRIRLQPQAGGVGAKV